MTTQQQPHEMLAERAEIIEQMQRMLNYAESHGRDLTKQEAETYAANERKIDELYNRAHRAKKLGTVVDGLNEPFDSIHRPTVNGQQSKRASNGALDAFLRTGDKSQFQNALTIGTDSAGVYTVVDDLDATLFETIAESNPIFADASRVVTSSDTFLRVYTTSGAASGRVAESGARGETTAPVYAQQSVKLSMQFAHPQVSEELLLASDYDLEGHISREVSTAFDADFEAEFLTGDGAFPNQQGILTAADSTDADGVRAFGSYQLIQGATTTGVTYDEIVGLLHSLPPRYRRNAKLYASTEVIQSMRLLKDGNQLPIWRDTDGGSGRPQSLLGVPVQEVPAMPGFGADAKTMIYGDLSQAYAFVSHSAGIQMQRDPFTVPGMVKFYTRLFCGSGPMDTRAARVFQQSAT